MAAFKPFDGEGMPLEEQFMSWKELNSQPYDVSADPYTKARVILMNGIENNAIITKHEIARSVGDPVVREALAVVRRAESMQQQAINWLNPADQSIVETTIGYEQLAVDLTANLAMNEDFKDQRAALNFALLEDFDHLFRYSCLMQVLEGEDARGLVKGTIELKEGRPTRVHHRHPEEEIRRHWNKDSASPKTKMNYLTIVSAEQQTELFYKSHGFMYKDELARGIYNEIADVEEEHVSQYENLGDGSMTPLEMNFLMEVNEAYNYFCCAQTEPDDRIRKMWEDMLRREMAHIKLAVQLLERIEGKDPEKVLGGDRIERPIVLQPTKDYVNQILEEQKDWQAYNKKFIPEADLPEDWPSYGLRERVNDDWVPSDEVVRRASGAAGKQTVTASAARR